MRLGWRIAAVSMAGAACLLALVTGPAEFAALALDSRDVTSARRVAERGPSDAAAGADLLQVRVRIRDAEGDVDGSLDALTALYRLRPDDPEIALDLAARLRAAGRLAQAHAVLLALPVGAVPAAERDRMLAELARDDPTAEGAYLDRLRAAALLSAPQAGRLGMIHAARGQDADALATLRGADDMSQAGLLAERLTLLDLLLASDARPEARARADRWQALMPQADVAETLELAFAARGLARDVPDDLPPEDPEGLRCEVAVRTWAIQLQSILPGPLHRSRADLLIIDPTDGIPGRVLPPETMTLLKHRPDRSRRLLLAYISIGQAESYRAYWRPEWSKTPPDWLIEPDPRWPGNYDVRYWDPAWQSLVFGSDGAMLDRLLNAGFDGVMLDGVDAFERRTRDRVDSGADMARFVADLARHARTKDPGFLVLPLNGHGLLDQPAFRGAIDGLVQEDLYFGSLGDGVANPPDGIRWTLDRLQPAAAMGLPVLLLEYLDADGDRQALARRAEADGLLPSFGVRQLDRISEPWVAEVPWTGFATGAACRD